jgi:hypothetical protein
MSTSFVMRWAMRAAAAAMLLAAMAAGTTSALADAPSFQEDVIPVLTRFGCNSGGCHGKLAGQKGFRLSLRGYAPELDYETVTREARGRRINPAAPHESLLVRKAIGEMPHGGGQRIERGSPAEKVLVDWIAAGAPGPVKEEARVAKIEISPAATALTIHASQPLKVTATYTDGRQRDVTWLTQFSSADEGMLSVTPAGLAKAERHGETIVRAAFHGQVEIATFTMPLETSTYPQWYAARNNAVDNHVMDKLAALRIEPSPLCDDATFLRRVQLDLIGVLPSPDEARAFIADNSTDKRSRKIDELLQRPEFVDHWSLWLGDLLQNRKERDHDVRGAKGVRSFHAWIRQQVAANRSWKDMASQVLLATGDCDAHPPVGYFIVTVGEKSAEESDVADAVAQAFLGTRIGCARCHNHPLEKFTQDDYYHFSAFLARVALKRQDRKEGPTELVVGTRHMLSLMNQQRDRIRDLEKAKAENNQGNMENAQKQIDELQQQIDGEKNNPVTVGQPRTGERLAPQPLDRSQVEIAPGSDPRAALVKWMTDPANEQFSGAMVNRLWKHFLGVGLMEPVDDLRATNPPTNAGLWKLLNAEFVQSNYDLQHVMRLICNSRTYQLSADTRPSNVHDTRYYSHFYARRLSAEVLLDAICDATGEPENFSGYPQGVRAMQVPDPAAESHFLTTFGRSPRVTACACERMGDVTLPQLLMLQNNDGLMNKLKSSAGRIHTLMQEQPDASQEAIIDELYLASVNRLPTADEKSQIIALTGEGDRREAFIDVLWAILNSKEFAFNH